MAIKIGSARHDENGTYTGGTAGDQLQTSSTNDTVGEVSMQDMYTHSKGWYVMRPKSVSIANKIASLMKVACNNANIGYDQNNRLGVITYGVNTTTKTECDCSSLIREIVKEATGVDPGNFTTANETSMLTATGYFEDKFAYVSQSSTPLYNGDILVTKSKGHTVAVVSGNARSESSNMTTTKKATEAAKSYDSSLAGTYKVTVSALNVRNGAGTSANKYGKDKSILVAIPNGTAVRNYGYYTTVDGTKWLYVQFTYNDVEYTGFASSKYLAK